MYFPERIPQASGDQVIAPIPANSPHAHTQLMKDTQVLVSVLLVIREEHVVIVTDFLKEVRELHFHFLSLEHVVLCLFTDWWDLVELPSH